MLSDKIKGLKQLSLITRRLQAQGKRVVFTNGCFDLLHFGHAQYLAQAKKKGDILIVAVNSDRSVKKIKGPKRPIIDQKNRLGLIASLECVDYVLVFNQDTPLRVIKTLQPDVLVKGADWNKDSIVGGEEVCAKGGRVSVIPLVKGLSTTNLIKKISGKF